MLQGAIAGIAAGGVYAIIAVSLTLMSRLVRVINFSQAAVGMMGAFVAAKLSSSGLPDWMAILVGIVVGVAISVAIGWILTRWLPQSPIGSRSAVTVAMLLLLISASYLLFGTRPLSLTTILSGPAFEISGVVISQVTVAMAALAIAIAVGAKLVLSRTSVGVKLRAIADRPIAAELMGVPVLGLSLGVWAITGLISVVVILIVAPTQTSDALSLSMLVVPAAAAALLGAFQRLDLALLGGFLLGIIQGALAQFPALTHARDWIPFVAIIVLLLWNQRKEVWDAAR